MADKLIIDWKEYNLIVEKLAIKINESRYKPDLLIGIALIFLGVAPWSSAACIRLALNNK